MKMNFCNIPPSNPYAPTTSTCNEPIISLNQPTRSPPIPITTTAEQNLSGLETWARNLPSPQTFPQLNQALTFPNAHYASRQPPQSNSPWLNQQPAPFTHSANVSLPPFWESVLSILLSADVYYPSDNFIKIPITTCEFYKTTSETTTYFFGAKTNDNHTYHLPPPSVAVCSDWARTLKSNCCGRLAQISDISWATSNAPAMVYVWPTTHRETVRNAVVSRITGIYDHLRKQLTSPLNSLSHCAIKKGSCITGNRIHI